MLSTSISFSSNKTYVFNFYTNSHSLKGFSVSNTCFELSICLFSFKCVVFQPHFFSQHGFSAYMILTLGKSFLHVVCLVLLLTAHTRYPCLCHFVEFIFIFCTCGGIESLVDRIQMLYEKMNTLICQCPKSKNFRVDVSAKFASKFKLCYNSLSFFYAETVVVCMLCFYICKVLLKKKTTVYINRQISVWSC